MSSHTESFCPLKRAKEDVTDAMLQADSPQTRSPSYRLAYQDPDFLLRDELRSLRLQMELLKPELIQQDKQIESTVVVFGGARIRDSESARAALDAAVSEAELNPGDPELKRRVMAARRAADNSSYYDEARRLCRLIAEEYRDEKRHNYVITTGGGPGIMEAANRGAHDAGAESIGLNIVLPMEQAPNPYITPELCFQFHYFAIRKMHFLMRAKALVVFPGGYGTLDELFETLTLVQTEKIRPLPILLFGKDFWNKVINFEALLEEGTISEGDLGLFKFVETAEEAWKIIRNT